MNTKITLVTILAVTVTGCVAGPGFDTSSLQPGGKCSNGNLKFSIGETFLNVTPKAKCAAPGDTIVAQIREHGNFKAVAGDIETTGGESWLDEDNGSNRVRITIEVPEATADGDYKYSLIVPGVGRLDPVVRVKK